MVTLLRLDGDAVVDIAEALHDALEVGGPRLQHPGGIDEADVPQRRPHLVAGVKGEEEVGVLLPWLRCSDPTHERTSGRASPGWTLCMMATAWRTSGKISARAPA